MRVGTCGSQLSRFSPNFVRCAIQRHNWSFFHRDPRKPSNNDPSDQKDYFDLRSEIAHKASKKAGNCQEIKQSMALKVNLTGFVKKNRNSAEKKNPRF